jgi:hypothetical protein
MLPGGAGILPNTVHLGCIRVLQIDSALDRGFRRFAGNPPLAFLTIRSLDRPLLEETLTERISLQMCWNSC